MLNSTFLPLGPWILFVFVPIICFIWDNNFLTLTENISIELYFKDFLIN